MPPVDKDPPASPPMGSSFDSADALAAALTDSVGAMIGYFDKSHRIGWTNRAFANWFGVEPEDLIGRAILDVYGHEAYGGFVHYLERAMAGEHVRYERLLERPEAPAMWISVSLSPHRAPGGEVLGVFASSLEVDELKRTRDELTKSLQIQSFYLDHSPLAVIEWDAKMRVTRWSGQAERIFGWSAVEVMGEQAAEIGLTDPDWLPTVQAVTSELLEGRTTSNRMIGRNRTRSGKQIYCEWFSSAFVDSSRKTQGILCLVQDVSARVEAEEQLRHAAVHDALTGCHNRQSLIARLTHGIARARRTGEKLALLFIDLDRFKPINDTHGHLIGDAVLAAVGRRLVGCVRESDTVARIGGDEFVVLLEVEVTWRTPEVIAKRIAEAFAAPFEVKGLSLSCGASLGMARFPEDGTDPDQLMVAADQAMYRVKQAR